MNIEHTFTVQPYRVGTGTGKNGSLAIVIPIKVRKLCEIDTSSIFLLKVNETNKTIMMRTIEGHRSNSKAILKSIEKDIEARQNNSPSKVW
jgi:hypothetical protein